MACDVTYKLTYKISKTWPAFLYDRSLKPPQPTQYEAI